jgi:hypothetical protein
MGITSNNLDDATLLSNNQLVGNPPQTTIKIDIALPLLQWHDVEYQIYYLNGHENHLIDVTPLF